MIRIALILIAAFACMQCGCATLSEQNHDWYGSEPVHANAEDKR